MPVIKCPNGKYRIGSGPCIYDTKIEAEKAWQAIRAKEHEAARKDLIRWYWRVKGMK